MKPMWKFLIFTSGSLMILITSMFFLIYSETKTIVEQKMFENVPSLTHRGEAIKKFNSQEPLTILLLGVDERPGDRGRSDTIILLNLNPQRHLSNIVSIPRDTWVELHGTEAENGKMDKINHAYAFGGSDMAIRTVEQFLNIEVDYYVKVNMEGLKGVVDTIGGIQVNNEGTFSSEGTTFPKGELSLTGEETLKFVRMRKDDPLGDLGRNERQRQVVASILNESRSLTTLTNIHPLIGELETNMTTNMKLKDISNIALNYRNAFDNLEHLQIKGSSIQIDNVYYLKITKEEIKRASALLNSP